MCKRKKLSSASVLRSVRETPSRNSRLHKVGFAKAAERCREVIAHVENDYVAKIRLVDGGACQRSTTWRPRARG